MTSKENVIKDLFTLARDNEETNVFDIIDSLVFDDELFNFLRSTKGYKKYILYALLARFTAEKTDAAYSVISERTRSSTRQVNTGSLEGALATFRSNVGSRSSRSRQDKDSAVIAKARQREEATENERSVSGIGPVAIQSISATLENDVSANEEEINSEGEPMPLAGDLLQPNSFSMNDGLSGTEKDGDVRGRDHEMLSSEAEILKKKHSHVEGDTLVDLSSGRSILPSSGQSHNSVNVSLETTALRSPYRMVLQKTEDFKERFTKIIDAYNKLPEISHPHGWNRLRDLADSVISCFHPESGKLITEKIVYGRSLKKLGDFLLDAANIPKIRLMGGDYIYHYKKVYKVINNNFDSYRMCMDSLRFDYMINGGEDGRLCMRQRIEDILEKDKWAGILNQISLLDMKTYQLDEAKTKFIDDSLQLFDFELTHRNFDRYPCLDISMVNSSYYDFYLDFFMQLKKIFNKKRKYLFGDSMQSEFFRSVVIYRLNQNLVGG